MNLIENKTILLPYIIANMALWEVFEEKYKDLSPLKCAELVEQLVPELIERADTLYHTNKQFRKGITSDEKGRDKLYMWFKHWGESKLKTILN